MLANATVLYVGYIHTCGILVVKVLNITLLKTESLYNAILEL